MVTTTSGFSRAAVLAGLLLSLQGRAAWSQEKTPLPPFTGERVIVKGVDDRFGDLQGQIARLEKSSPQSYYVVVVKSTGPGSSATVKYIDELRDSWLRQKGKRGQSFDPDRSVLIVVALEKRQVALLPGTALRKEFGLQGAVAERELIPVFIDLAKGHRYPEAIAALLNATNNWIAKRDPKTELAQIQPAHSASRSSKSSSSASTGSEGLNQEAKSERAGQTGTTLAEPQPVK
jgi:hypothetical protein